MVSLGNCDGIPRMREDIKCVRRDSHRESVSSCALWLTPIKAGKENPLWGDN